MRYHFSLFKGSHVNGECSSSKFSCSTKSKSEKNDVNVQTPPSKLNDEQWLKPHCNVHLTPRFSLARIQPAMIIFKKSLFVVLIISSLLCRFFASFHPYPLFMISQLKSRFDKRKNMFFSKPKSTSQKIIGHDTKALTRDKLKANFLLFVHALTIYSQGSYMLAKFFCENVRAILPEILTYLGKVLSVKCDAIYTRVSSLPLLRLNAIPIYFWLQRSFW